MYFLQTLYAPLLSPIRARCLAYLSRLNLITRIIFGEEKQLNTLRYVFFATLLLPHNTTLFDFSESVMLLENLTQNATSSIC